MNSKDFATLYDEICSWDLGELSNGTHLANLIHATLYAWEASHTEDATYSQFEELETLARDLWADFHGFPGRALA